MNDLPRQKLCEIIAKYGQSLCETPRRCEALLRDLCGQYRQEIFVLVSALKEGVATELLNSRKIPHEVIQERLTRKLQDHLGLAEEPARWAVDSWALALRVTLMPTTLGTIPRPIPTPIPVSTSIPVSNPLPIPASTPFSTLAPPQVQPKLSPALWIALLRVGAVVGAVGIAAISIINPFKPPSTPSMPCSEVLLAPLPARRPDYQYKNSAYYGSLKDGTPDGFGIWIFKNGDRYDGEHQKAKFNGCGTYRYSSSSTEKYVGQFQDNKSDGLGTLTFRNGDRYIGEFKDHQCDGQGTFVSKGKFTRGKWSKDNFVGGKLTCNP